MTELADEVYEGVRRLCATGDTAVNRGDYQEAIGWYERALALLPSPVTRWEAATWIFAALADAYFSIGDSDGTLRSVDQAMQSPNSFGNPFLHLRRGQALFDLGRKDEAANELARAFMLGDEDIFADEDPQYMEFLKTVLRPPAGGWRT